MLWFVSSSLHCSSVDTSSIYSPMPPAYIVPLNISLCTFVRQGTFKPLKVTRGRVVHWPVVTRLIEVGRGRVVKQVKANKYVGEFLPHYPLAITKPLSVFNPTLAT